MTRSTGQRSFHFKNSQPADPTLRPWAEWLPLNREFLADFRCWLKDGGYGASTLSQYGVAVRLALSLLDKPYFQIDPDVDLKQVRQYVARRFPKASTRKTYLQGLDKLSQYLRFRGHKPAPKPSINWEHYLQALPTWLAEDVAAYLRHRRRTWLPENSRRVTLELLGHLARLLRWMVSHTELTDIGQITPALWFDYVDERLAADIKPNTLNRELYDLQDFLRFLAEQNRPVCARMLQVEPLARPDLLPRDVPLDQLRRLLAQIEQETRSPYPQQRYTAVMDRAWVGVMLYSGLRTGEVRRLRLTDLELAARQVRIEQAKGLKDRIVYLNEATVEALEAYLAIRGPAATNHLFIYRHQPLASSYCGHRLQTYGQRCGLRVSPHQLRHSCATLLLNAGAPILTVQTILGHKHIDTTLGYARLYDGTVAADYYRAMAVVERRLTLEAQAAAPTPTSGYLLALVDSLQAGTLNEAQRETVQILRSAIWTMTETEAAI